ncbi:MAG: hypothetical protein F4W95_13070 [Chloroflexi bacterium]|nr:hypothetical protein [Chloroflexota bacterium]MYD49401.1 hypothetical protein [Chloroflexota bacterium]
MAEELSRITRPAAANYQGKRKLLLVPLIQLPVPPDAIPPEGAEIIARYWEQVDVQVRAVQNALGSITRIYHENLPQGGDDGLAYLEASGQGSHALVKTLSDAGAVLETIESMDILAETLDLQRCLMQPLMSQTVASRLQEWLIEASRRRNDFIADAIDSTLPEDETGLLLISERHQVQFPADLEVIYIAPPALDEFRRWLQSWTETLQRQMAEQTQDLPPGEAEASEDASPNAPA